MLQTDSAAREQELRDWLRSAGIADDKASYTPDEIARLLDIAPRTIRRYVASGIIRTVCIEHRERTLYRIPRTFLFALIEGSDPC